MSNYETKRTLRSFWREEGNPRLKGLLLAALPNTGVRAEDVGRAWVDDPKERERMLELAPPRTLTAPVSQSYAPGAHDGAEESRELENVARTLASDEFGSDDEAKRFLAGDTGMDKDKYIKRALLQDSVTELDVLFREELETSIIMGAQPRKVFRDAANVVNVSKRKGDLPRGSNQTYAGVYSQGATIGTGDRSYDTVPYECVKVAQAFEITDELVNESEPDVVEDLVRATGAAVENTINRIALVEALDNAGGSFDAQVGGTLDASAVQALNGAATQVDLANFGPADTAVVHPEFEQALFDDSNVVYANRGGSTQPLQDRQLGGIMGMERWESSDGTYNNGADTDTVNPSNTWGYANTGEYGAIAYERDQLALVVWQDFDMATKDYEDPIRDLQGSNVRSWVDAVYKQPDAAATVTY